MKPEAPSINDILDAVTRLKGVAHHTPVLSSSSVNEMLGLDLHFKCENFQRVGAFKFRGAYNAVSAMNATQLLYGVATHSSGNHAAALSLAAKMKGIPAFVVMPSNSTPAKIQAVEHYGGKITFCPPTLESRETYLAKILEKTGATFVHPSDDFFVIAGQGTAALEFLEEEPNLDIIVAPVGGGGLLSGTAIAARASKLGIEVIGAEPEQADDACRSFRTGTLQPSLNPTTIADGLLTSLGPRTFEIIQEKVSDIITTSEASIRLATRLIWQRMKIIVEPSSAVALAVIMDNPGYFRDKKTGIILSGGNANLDKSQDYLTTNRQVIG
jgi:threonine dehydratase